MPTIEIEVEPDPVSGVNIHIDVTNFELAPERASMEAVPGEGHFHTYVDGRKVGRFYNRSIHLPLPEGDHRVMVELSANDHATYAIDGAPIMDQADVSVPAPTDHGHGQHDGRIEAGDPVPTIDLTVTPDPKAGWNVHAAVEDLSFAPRSAGDEHVDGEGHLHLYVDSEKVARLYGEWWHLDPLAAGGHEITVEATANDHSPYIDNGEPLAVSVSIDVTEEQAAGAGSVDTDDHDHNGGDEAGSAALLDVPVDDADTIIEIVVADGSVERDDTRVVVDEGSTVGLIVSSDSADNVHLHGYEILAAVGPGDPVELVFSADSSGVFEVELENAGLFLFDLQVG